MKITKKMLMKCSTCHKDIWWTGVMPVTDQNDFEFQHGICKCEGRWLLKVVRKEADKNGCPVFRPKSLKFVRFTVDSWGESHFLQDSQKL